MESVVVLTGGKRLPYRRHLFVDGRFPYWWQISPLLETSNSNRTPPLLEEDLSLQEIPIWSPTPPLQEVDASLTGDIY